MIRSVVNEVVHIQGLVGSEAGSPRVHDKRQAQVPPPLSQPPAPPTLLRTVSCQAPTPGKGRASATPPLPSPILRPHGLSIPAAACDRLLPRLGCRSDGGSLTSVVQTSGEGGGSRLGMSKNVGSSRGKRRRPATKAERKALDLAVTRVSGYRRITCGIVRISTRCPISNRKNSVSEAKGTPHVKNDVARRYAEVILFAPIGLFLHELLFFHTCFFGPAGGWCTFRVAHDTHRWPCLPTECPRRTSTSTPSTSRAARSSRGWPGTSPSRSRKRWWR